MKIVNKTSVGQRRVYDIEVEGVHNFYANGVNVHNCATDGGVSVIKDDGTVVDLPTSGIATAWVAFTESNQLASMGNYGDRWVLREIPNADVANLETGDATFVAKPYRQYGQSADYQRQVSFGDTYASDLGVSKNGLLLEHGAGSALGSTSLVALLTSTYNTGWMPGDIKLAALSDTDDTDLVGSGELVTNGTFDTDTSGWTGRNANTTLAVSSGKLSVSAGAADTAYAYQQITAEAGTPLVLTLDYFDITGTPRVYIGIGPGTNTYYDSGNLSGNGSLTVTFTPTSANPYISLYASVTATLSLESQYDNISVKLADPSRSV
jgi:hypothetical protein